MDRDPGGDVMEQLVTWSIIVGSAPLLAGVLVWLVRRASDRFACTAPSERTTDPVNSPSSGAGAWNDLRSGPPPDAWRRRDARE
jgi:hypothetical protein